MNNNNTTSLQATKIGFIGCGTIAVAIATGIATQGSIQVESIQVTRRSEAKSSKLQQTFPDLVKIRKDNQDILDASDLIFLCVLPEQTSSVLQELNFNKERHTLVSLVSTAKLEDLIQDSKLPASSVSKMICLPSIAQRKAVSLHCCPTPNLFLTDLLKATGGVTTLKTEADLEASMMTVSALCIFDSAKMIDNGINLSYYFKSRRRVSWAPFME
jgi:pyrroline-5-carboxylate reductase